MLDIPGIISIDTRTLLMKDQALERRSLNEYLKANNLPLKLEVSFEVMNRAFKSLQDCRELTVEQLADIKRDLDRIYEYCVYDADACRLLWEKRNVIH